jgi:hypothetical protein
MAPALIDEDILQDHTAGPSCGNIQQGRFAGPFSRVILLDALQARLHQHQGGDAGWGPALLPPLNTNQCCSMIHDFGKGSNGLTLH